MNRIIIVENFHKQFWQNFERLKNQVPIVKTWELLYLPRDEHQIKTLIPVQPHAPRCPMYSWQLLTTRQISWARRTMINIKISIKDIISKLISPRKEDGTHSSQDPNFHFCKSLGFIVNRVTKTRDFSKQKRQDFSKPGSKTRFSQNCI